MARTKKEAATAALPLVTRAAIYTRVSTEEQAIDGYGLDVQRKACESYAAAFGYEVVRHFADEGVSGTKDETERPGLLAALSAAQRREYDVLIAPAVDRLARKASILLTIWDALEAAGVVIVAVKERIDTSTPAGRLSRTMFAAIAEFERDTIVERTKAGRNERGRKDGERGGRVPFGYTRLADGNIMVDPAAADVVRQIFAARAAGDTLTDIADELNAAGVTPARADQRRYTAARWYASTVKSVLMNEAKYRGGRRGDSPVNWTPIL